MSSFMPGRSFLNLFFFCFRRGAISATGVTLLSNNPPFQNLNPRSARIAWGHLLSMLNSTRPMLTVM